MGMEEIVELLGKGGAFYSIEALKRELPEHGAFIDAIHKKVSSLKGATYVVAVASFFDSPTRALELISQTLIGDWYASESGCWQFYLRQKAAYQKRCANKVKHSLNILECSLTSHESKGIPAQRTNHIEEDNPSFHDVEKLYEES